MKTSCSLLLLTIYFYCEQQLQAKASDNFAVQEEPNTVRRSTLKLAHVLFRHGIRTPVNTYANDPYKNETFQPFGWGQLTNDGKRDLYQMGEWLAKRYQNFMAPYYMPNSLYARSTASPRTLMSMATVLAGMYPPNNTPMKWNYQLNWQPIPIFSENLHQDVMLRMQTECKAYTEMRQQLTSGHVTLFDELTELTGENVTSPSDVNSIFITLWAEQLYGLKLPEWAHEYYPDKMRFMAEQSYVDLVSTTSMQRIKSGPFLQTLIDQMLAKVNRTLEPIERKLFLYCAHDWTITNILIALKVWKRQMPDFAALFLFELHQNPESKEFYTELYFQNGPKGQLESLTLPGCIFQCPLARTVELLEDVLPTGTYEEMCNVG